MKKLLHAISRRKLLSLSLLLALAAALGLVWCGFSRSHAAYDANYLATEETAMWKAYYGKDKARLAWHLVMALRRQFGISAYEAGKTGHLLAAAAMKFKTAGPGHYDEALPDLTAAYAQFKSYAGLAFDPVEAAKADLAWWVDRRDPQRRNPQAIGQGITRLYETIYGYHHPGFDRAGQLRADAAHTRDQGGEHCDWGKVKEQLLLSYTALKEGIDGKPTPK